MGRAPGLAFQMVCTPSGRVPVFSNRSACSSYNQQGLHCPDKQKNPPRLMPKRVGWFDHPSLAEFIERPQAEYKSALMGKRYHLSSRRVKIVTDQIVADLVWKPQFSGYPKRRNRLWRVTTWTAVHNHFSRNTVIRTVFHDPKTFFMA